MRIQSLNNYNVNFNGQKKHGSRYHYHGQDSMKARTIDYYTSEQRLELKPVNNSFRYKIEGAERFDDDSDDIMENIGEVLFQDGEVNNETKELINTRLSKYSDKKNGMVYYNSAVLNAMYGLSPEIISGIGSNRVLYTMCAEENEIKSLFGTSALSTKERIAKLAEIEKTFTKEDLENITFSMYENSHQATDFLRWLLLPNSPEEEERLVERAKEPVEKLYNFKSRGHKKTSWFKRIFKH